MATCIQGREDRAPEVLRSDDSTWCVFTDLARNVIPVDVGDVGEAGTVVEREVGTRKVFPVVVEIQWLSELAPDPICNYGVLAGSSYGYFDDVTGFDKELFLGLLAVSDLSVS